MKSGFEFFSETNKKVFPYTETSYVFYKKIGLNRNTVPNNGVFNSGIPKDSNALFFINCDEVSIFESFFDHINYSTDKNYIFNIRCNMDKTKNLFLYVFVPSLYHKKNITQPKWGIQLFNEKGELSHVSGQLPLSLHTVQNMGVNFQLKEKFKLATLVKMYGYYSVQQALNGWARIGVTAIGVKNEARFAHGTIGRGIGPMGSSPVDPVLAYIDCTLYD
ncbi:hypothetical protein [Providencia manganoxydans]|uniref:hypothetical protein n=1 Tax=Providencia manganoxydans TaxID=2923283 RepID=UPI0034E5F4C4